MQATVSRHVVPIRARYLIALVALSLATAWHPQVYAADCTLQLSESELDYGRMTRSEITKDKLGQESLPLQKRHVTLNAICAQSSEMTLFLRAPAADADSFRLGDGGSFSVYVEHALLDGAPVSLGDVRTVGEPALQISNAMPLRPDHGVQLVSEGRATKGSRLSLQLVIQPRINATSSKRRDEATWYEQGVFEMVTP